jgi:hypothetical protein
MEQLVEYADGWIPIGGHGLTEAIPRYHDALSAAGRDPDSVRVIPFGSLPTPDKIAHFAAIGVSECVFRLPSAPPDDVLAVLEQQGELLAQLR